MGQIVHTQARQILDSRGNPTVEVDLYTSDGGFGRAAIPSGASTGVHEAIELRDGDKNYYLGKGVLQAVKNVNNVIAPEVQNMDVSDQIAIDQHRLEIDGSENKANLAQMPYSACPSPQLRLLQANAHSLFSDISAALMHMCCLSQ